MLVHQDVRPSHSRTGSSFVRLNLAILSLATALHTFDARLFAVRLRSPVQPDSLVHYNMLLAWWRHSDSPRGFTLTPSPYFIDMVLQLPIMLLAPDFERFSYALACAYALLILASLYLVLRIALETGPILALAAAGATVAGFYKLAPFNFVVHAFVVNHTSEIFTTLGLLALLHAWFRPGAPRRPYAAYGYTLAVAVCVASSPFFIATYVIPAAVAATAILGTEYVTRRRLAWFLGLTAVGALAGLIALALISRYAWPVRGDYYHGWWRSYLTFKRTIIAEPGGISVVWATACAVLASGALAIVGRRTRRWSIPTTFMLAFFPASVVACVGIPIKRGAFDGGYAFRYVTLPSLLMVAFYVATAARVARALGAAVLRGRTLPAAPRWLPWSAAALGVLGIAVGATCRGPLTMYDEASRTAGAIRCFRAAEQRGDVEDGLATWWLARYLNAARHATGWESPHVIVQLLHNDPPALDPRDNNLRWFAGSYRGGAAKLNFLATHALSDGQLQFFRDRIGAPDRTITCPVPVDLRPDGKATYELWIWDREDAQRRLGDLATHHNLRSPFSPAIGATSMVIDPVWGMDAGPGMSELAGRRRVWRRGTHRSADGLAWINPLWLPSGRYRLAIDLTAVPLTAVPTRDRAAPVAEVEVYQQRRGELARFSIAAGASNPSFEFVVDNRGGATSGEAIALSLHAREAESIELSGATLTLLEPRGIAPFRIFR
jgi:hypothetical protein